MTQADRPNDKEQTLPAVKPADRDSRSDRDSNRPHDPGRPEQTRESRDQQARDKAEQAKADKIDHKAADEYAKANQAPPTPATYDQVAQHNTFRMNMAVLADELAGVVRAIGHAEPGEQTSNALVALRATSDRFTRMAAEGEAARTNLRNQ